MQVLVILQTVFITQSLPKIKRLDKHAEQLPVIFDKETQPAGKTMHVELMSWKPDRQAEQFVAEPTQVAQLESQGKHNPSD